MMKTSRSSDSNVERPGEAIRWRGRSGHFYALAAVAIDNFVLKDHDLYLIAEGNKARWIGTAGDLINDGASRAGFRSAVKVASAVLRLSAPADMVARMTVKWDLEGGEPAGNLYLAGAA